MMGKPAYLNPEYVAATGIRQISHARVYVYIYYVRGITYN